MLLEVKAWGTDTFYDKVVPMLTTAGFKERDDLHAADPASDGELMFLYYELATDGLPVAEFQTLMADVEKLIKDNGDPSVGLSLVRSRPA